MSHIHSPCRISKRDWSTGTRIWDGLTVELHRFDELDLPSSLSRLHLDSFRRRRRSGSKEKSSERSKARTEPSGNICIFSVEHPRQVRTFKPLEVLVMTLSADALGRAGTGSSGPSLPELVEHHLLHDQQIEDIALTLKAEAESGYLSGSLYGDALSLALSSRLLARYSTTDHRLPEQKGGLSPRSLRRVIDHIHANLAATSA